MYDIYKGEPMNCINRINLGLYGVPQRAVMSINLAPENYTEGGGFLDDTDVTFLALKFITSEGTPYDKGNNKTVPLLKVDMLPEGTEEVHTQYFSCGDLANWAPSQDGETLVDVKKSGGNISKSCNAAIFLTSLVTAGVPNAKFASERISDFAGIKAHVVRTKRPKDNIKRAEGTREPDVLTVARLISVPWGAVSAPIVAAKAHQGATPTQTPAASHGNGNGAFGDDQLAMLAVTVLGEHGGTLKKSELMTAAYKAAVSGAVPADAKDADGKSARITVAQRITNDAFLGSQPFWQYDGNVVTLL